MKIKLRTLLLVYTTIFLSLNLVQCSTSGKIAPEYSGVDPRAEPFVKEFKEIAKNRGITFKHEVTVGFKNINDGDTIGLTNYGLYFREIDIDKSFWNNSNEIKHETLLFHELVHAYCDRGHTWGSNIPYPEYDDWHGKKPKEGRYKDESYCPLTIMYPVILDDYCVLMHYDDYIIEMFNRCKPY